MLHATAPTRLHQMVEHLPTILVRGTKKSGPKARPATAADIYRTWLAGRGGHRPIDELMKKTLTE